MKSTKSTPMAGCDAREKLCFLWHCSACLPMFSWLPSPDRDSAAQTETIRGPTLVPEQLPPPCEVLGESPQGLGRSSGCPGRPKHELGRRYTSQGLSASCLNWFSYPTLYLLYLFFFPPFGPHILHLDIQLTCKFKISLLT